MRLALGIDTGGTYTDAVLVDYDTGAVLRGAKALTTKQDLSLGIREAIDRILGNDAQNICLVAISTTLATNAIVEGKGASICLLLLGYDRRLIDDYGFKADLVTENYVFLPGRHNLAGEEEEPLDLELTRQTILEWKDRVEAFAISGYFGTRNPAHEQKVRQLVEELTGLPTTCGFELTTRLNSIRRATTVALNARLIPFLRALMESVQRAMSERGIEAPLMVVRGDGALMDARLARQRPVETILSGPAASVIGAKHLMNIENGLVVDVGGTTTDIAVLRNGRPGINPAGARVGGWRTMVEAVDMRTAGIGGDSYVRVTRERELLIGPRRVIPLCILATQYPDVLKELQKQLVFMEGYDERAGEFMQQMRPIATNGRELEPAEKELLSALANGPRSLIHLTSGTRFPRHYLSHLYAWENEGYLLRAGFTPTDAAHVLGLYGEWNSEASLAGARILARMADLDVETLCRRVIDGTSNKIAREVLGKVLEDERGLSLNNEDRLGAFFVDNALGADATQSSLHCSLKLDYNLVAIGAPVATYMPKVAHMLNTELSIPQYCGLANAIGAVSGSVVQIVRLLLQPTEEGERVRLHAPTGVSEYSTYDEGIAAARQLGRELVAERVQLAGAEEYEIQIEQHDQRVKVAAGWGDEIYLGTELIFTAAGRPGLVKRSAPEAVTF
jgi:N-methylhydantoinase A/oxoprolinase/acetone carboxylase beta subunit